ncbi:tetratricopeptide repeat protein [Pacificimonas sp. WHA3]|uniref:Tetratricopeptide repeat protein n=1 Tax=Pacificimonas pallii TaxID=2827236 RepID=A0ABS6SBY3_9SPHN|nr:tetratricopeptide repeat protein [Pacificimonas pallii]MBV7255431.1 tetratricopeptide repeat protein [Pacificimonas pallii]
MAKAPSIPDSNENPESDAFLREVDDAYRTDRLSGFWQRYGRWILIAVGVFLIALAGILWMQQERVAERGLQAEAFDKAVKGLDLGSSESRAEIERFAASDIDGYNVLAKMLQARLSANDGDVAGAAAGYRAIADDSAVPQPIRDLALIQAVRLTFDDAEPENVVAELSPLAKADSPWFGVAGEMLGAAHLKSGNEEAARTVYAAMAGSETIPPTLRGRASQLAAMLGGAVPEDIADELALDEPTAPEANAAADTADIEETGE